MADWRAFVMAGTRTGSSRRPVQTAAARRADLFVLDGDELVFTTASNP